MGSLHKTLQRTTDNNRGEDRRMPMRDPLTISPEEDEEQMIMRRLRNSCDELRRGFRWLDYRMQRVKQKAGQSRENREISSCQRRKSLSEGSQSLSRLTSPWTR